jgi:L-ascorbate metabolism protein UlaG (beta-lactamase superfamily)
MPTINQISYLGHATLLLEIDGVRILTDPLLRDGVFHLERRSQPVDAAQYQKIDAVMISHLHWDHLDILSLRLLGPEVHLIVPNGAAGLLKKKGFQNAVEMRAGDRTEVGRLTIQATHAEHNHRMLFYQLPAGCLGYLVRGSRTVYFAGDTDLFAGMADLAGDLDLALLPVWGWGPALGRGHMDGTRAAQALTLLRPRMAVPIHWGTFYPRWVSWLRHNRMTQPPQIFLREGGKLMPNVKIEILPPGTSLSL